jgi:hypothetical protein
MTESFPRRPVAPGTRYGLWEVLDSRQWYVVAKQPRLYCKCRGCGRRDYVLRGNLVNGLSTKCPGCQARARSRRSPGCPS